VSGDRPCGWHGVVADEVKAGRALASTPRFLPLATADGPCLRDTARMALDDDRPEHPWLRIESRHVAALVKAEEAVRIRDGLRRVGGKTEEQLATIIDAKATELLAAPLYAGTVSVRIDADEEQCLLDLLRSWSQTGSISDDDNIGRLWAELTPDVPPAAVPRGRVAAIMREA
jgi:hypothetical protein